MGELADFAGQICETLNKSTGCIAAVSDRDTIISVSGLSRRELSDKRISAELEQIMEGRQIYQYTGTGNPFPAAEGVDKYFMSVAAPIISEGDVMGCVMFIAPEGGGTISEVEYKLAQTVAGFLGKQMES